MSRRPHQRECLNTRVESQGEAAELAAATIVAGVSPTSTTSPATNAHVSSTRRPPVNVATESISSNYRLARKNSMVVSRPSLRAIVGSQPSVAFARLMSGWRRMGSSCGNGKYSMAELVPVFSMTNCANSPRTPKGHLFMCNFYTSPSFLFSER